ALLEGKEVVLYGDLSKELYDAIETLFKTSPVLKLYSSMTPEKVLGKLIIVTTPPPFDTIVANLNKRTYSVSEELLWEEYKKELKLHPVYERYGEKLFMFFRYIK